MRELIKRLWLGVLLIVATSSVLLISDRNQRRTPKPRVPRVAIVQHASQGILDEGVRGIIDGLAENGFVEPGSVEIQRFSAENDVPTSNAIARQVTAGQFDLILTATTLSLQTVAGANKSGKTRHVFGLVTDPFGAGVGIDRANPLRHPSHLTGLGTMQPVEAAFRLAKRLRPSLKTVGVAWNPTESNSEANTVNARQVCRELGIELLEANVENSSAVSEAAASLTSRGVETLWVGGDVTVLVAFDSLMAAARRGRIPVFTNMPGNAKRGALFDLGANYHEVGRLVGELGSKVLRGTSPADIPVKNVVPETLAVNQQALAGLKDRWEIPADVMAKANVTFDAQGVEHKSGVALKQAAGAPGQRLAKKWNLHLIEFNNVLDVEETEQGVLEGLKEAKLVEGRDYQIQIHNAQGDMPTVMAMVDASVGDGADLLITLSTPTLQAAIQRAKGTPIIFTYVADAVAAGAGRTNEDHLPGVTGVPMLGAFPEMMALLRQCLPSAKRIGTLFVPSEVNMVINKDKLVTAAAKVGIIVETAPVSTSSEVPDAAQALLSRQIDALCQIPGNLTAAAFGGIAQAAGQKRVPVFAFQKVQARDGAAVVLSRDYHQAGHEAAHLAARVIRGESPATIPFQPLTQTMLLINLAAAQNCGLRIPPALLSQAAQVIRH